MVQPSRLRTLALTGLTLIAFAANSVLCRLALGPRSIDPASFTSVRIGAGAAMLALLLLVHGRGRGRPRAGSWVSALALFGYALAFSLAYVSLEAGTGALILFGSVQLTMIGWGWLAGERPARLEWAGLALAVGGLVWLFLPGVTAPSPRGAGAMVLAGVAWGVYSLRGRRASDPVATTRGNFSRALPLALVASAVAWRGVHLEPAGVALAAASGALASGLGYVLWYAALAGLTSTSAAIVQLAVPVLAALGGAALLDERVTLRLLLAGAAILGGVGLALGARFAAAATGRRPR